VPVGRSEYLPRAVGWRGAQEDEREKRDRLFVAAHCGASNDGDHNRGNHEPQRREDDGTES